jgi:uncharacterized integral membrane protein
MNPLPFIIGAYAATIVGTVLVVAISYAAMRKAERQADEIRGDR